MVKCKGCYTPFAVDGPGDPQELRDRPPTTTSHRCPSCGISRPYDAGDLYFAGDQPGTAPGGLGLGGPGSPW